MKNNLKGQAAILIVFVTGMLGLLMGMILSKTGFAESMMGRSVSGSTYAFYVANSGVEDAFYKITKADKEGGDFENKDGYYLSVGEGIAKVTVVNETKGDETRKIITSSGKHGNYLRKIRVSVFNTKITPEFTRIIQVGYGGIEIENNVKISAKDNGVEYTGGNIHSNSFIKGKSSNNNGNTCGNSSSHINGTASAVDNIDKLGNTGSGPCISGNAYAGNLKYCKVFGNYAYSANGYNIDCQIDNDKRCDPLLDPANCYIPQPIDLPNLKTDKIKNYMQTYANSYAGNCIVGGANDCSTTMSGKKYLGNIIINGNLTINSDIYLNGPVWVTNDLRIRSNNTIYLDPSVSDLTSLLILSSGKIETESNVMFTSGASSYLLLASEYNDYINDSTPLCDEGNGNAITINSNVKSILFYAINGCALVKGTSSYEFFGAILAQAAKLESNVNLYYDPNLKNAVFYLSQNDPWQISSFTEI